MIQIVAKLFDFIENGVYWKEQKQTHIAPHDQIFVTELMGYLVILIWSLNFVIYVLPYVHNSVTVESVSSGWR